MSRGIERVGLSSLIGAVFLFCGAVHPAFAYEDQVKLLAAEMSDKIGDGAKTIAVLDFTDLQGNVTELGRFLAEEVSIALAEVGKKYDVIDRNNLAALLKEHKLSASGLVDPQSARRLGQLAGVQALVMGSLTPFGDDIRVTVKILDTNTARMIGSSRGNIAKTGAIQELFAKGIVPGATGGESSARASSGGAPGAVQKADTMPQVVESNKFFFELQGCELSGQTITCALAILNTGKDRVLTINADTRLFDDHGNEYAPASGELANTAGEFPYRSSRIEKTLLYDVPVVASLTFEGISPQTTSVTSLHLQGRIDERDLGIDFRGISLESKRLSPIRAGLRPGGGAAGGSIAGKAGEILQEEVGEPVKEKARKALRKWTSKLLGEEEDEDDGGGD